MSNKILSSSSVKEEEKIKQNRFKDIDFWIKFLWLCSGANIKVLQKAQADRNKYASIGFSILLISILASISGGYALWTVFENLIITIFGGALWGLMLGSMDRFVVSSVRKTENSTVKERIGSTVFFFLRLSISVLISFIVAKPLELRLFAPSIDAELGRRNQRVIQEFDETLDRKYNSEFEKLTAEKQKYEDELNELQAQQDRAQEILNRELTEGGGNRAGGVGPVTDRLQQAVARAEERYENRNQQLRPLIDDINQRIDELEEDKDTELAEQTERQEGEGKGFIARLSVLHEIQKQEEKIIVFGKETNEDGTEEISGLGIYGLTGWLIAIIFILIDTTPIIIKLFTNRSVYDALLEKTESEQKQALQLLLEAEYEIERDKFIKEKESTKQLNETKIANETEIQKKKSDVYRDLMLKRLENKKQSIDTYFDKHQQITEEAIRQAVESADLRQIQADITETHHNLFQEGTIVNSARTQNPPTTVDYNNATQPQNFNGNYSNNGNGQVPVNSTANNGHNSDVEAREVINNGVNSGKKKDPNS